MLPGVPSQCNDLGTLLIPVLQTQNGCREPAAFSPGSPVQADLEGFTEDGCRRGWMQARYWEGQTVAGPKVLHGNLK